jgi:cytoskeletal protein CcmA (bactofilin family)
MVESKDAKRTLVEEGTELKGSLTSTCPILVRGRVEGEIKAPALTVSPSGAVHGRAKVGELSADGELSGEFDAEVITLAGSVKDKTIIKAKTLSVKLASENGKLSVMFGECDLEVGDPPPKIEE